MHLLRYEIIEGRIEPSYIDGRYAGLIRALSLHHEAHSGKPYRLLDRSILESPGISIHDRRLVAGLRKVLEKSMDLEVAAPADPRKIRDAVFSTAGGEPDLEAGEVYRRAGESLGLPAAPGAEHLYADLRAERVVRFPRPIPPVAEVISRYNFRLIQGLLSRASSVRIRTDGQARAIYRFARLHGLLVELKGRGREDPGLELEITGPLSLFQLTRKYGRALGRFLPACAIANRFHLEARICMGECQARLEVSNADRLLSSHVPPREFDSKVERRFLKDFLGMDSRWSVQREEQLIPLGSTVFIPDFTFRLKGDPSFRVDLEIVGFWTRDYLARKRALIERLPRGRIIFCVDESLSCDRESIPFPCILYRRRVPAEQVLEILESYVKRSEKGR